MGVLSLSNVILQMRDPGQSLMGTFAMFTISRVILPSNPGSMDPAVE